MAVGKTMETVPHTGTSVASLVRVANVEQSVAPKSPAVIPQRGFGTLTSTSTFGALETHGLRSCVAIIGVNQENGSTFMTHIDGGTRGELSLLRERVGQTKHTIYLVYTAPEKTEVENVRSLVRGRNLEAAREFTSGLNAEVREVIQECEIGSIGVSRDGQLYKPDPKNFRSMTVGELFKLLQHQIGPFFDMDRYHSASTGIVGSYY